VPSNVVDDRGEKKEGTVLGHHTIPIIYAPAGADAAEAANVNGRLGINVLPEGLDPVKVGVDIPFTPVPVTVLNTLKYSALVTGTQVPTEAALYAVMLEVTVNEANIASIILVVSCNTTLFKLIFCSNIHYYYWSIRKLLQ
jgi:hypothetical protein